MLGAAEQLSVAVAVALGRTATPLASKEIVVLLATIVGAALSTTVTALVAVVTFPEASVAVIVTVFEPRSAQPNALGVMLTVGADVQLSDVLLTTSDVAIVAAPEASNVTVTAPDTVAIVGALLSTTVNVTCEVVAFPEASVATTVTVLLPRSVQEKVLGVIVNIGVPQLSPTLDARLLIEIEAAPEASSATSANVLNMVTVGAMLSSTVTVNVCVATLPLASAAVTVTVLAPRSEQVNVVLLYVTFGVEVQLSAAVAVADGSVTTPLPSSANVVLLTVITGAALFTTEIVLVAVDVLPASSVAVIVTVTEPASLQVKLLGLTLNDGVAEQLSVAEARSLALTEPAPEASRTRE